jgi:hypothetical protein
LAKKLGISATTRVAVLGAPGDYEAWLAPLPVGASIVRSLADDANLVHLFATERTALAAELARLRQRLADDVPLWVSWPKKAARVPTDVTEDVVRALALPLGFVDVKVCAVSAVWSGLKLVVRMELRHAGGG